MKGPYVSASAETDPCYSVPMIEHVIGPLIEKIIESAGAEAAKDVLTAAFKKLSKKTNKKLTAKDKTELHKEVESLVTLATFEDVKEFDPKYRMITNAMMGRPAKKAVKKAMKKAWTPAGKPAKKAPAKKALWHATKKAPAKKSGVRAAPFKKAPRR
jgi:hypothetical protein